MCFLSIFQNKYEKSSTAFYKMTDVIPNVFFILTEQSVILRFRIERHLFRNKLRSLVFRFLN